MSCSTAKASISGNSVVPGLPNMTVTPSCLSRSRKARFPDITGTISSSDFADVFAGREANTAATVDGSWRMVYRRHGLGGNA